MTWQQEVCVSLFSSPVGTRHKASEARNTEKVSRLFLPSEFLLNIFGLTVKCYSEQAPDMYILAIPSNKYTLKTFSA